jgi:hypothetical protein
MQIVNIFKELQPKSVFNSSFHIPKLSHLFAMLLSFVTKAKGLQKVSYTDYISSAELLYIHKAVVGKQVRRYNNSVKYKKICVTCRGMASKNILNCFHYKNTF